MQCQGYKNVPPPYGRRSGWGLSGAPSSQGILDASAGLESERTGSIRAVKRRSPFRALLACTAWVLLLGLTPSHTRAAGSPADIKPEPAPHSLFGLWAKDGKCETRSERLGVSAHTMQFGRSAPNTTISRDLVAAEVVGDHDVIG